MKHMKNYLLSEATKRAMEYNEARKAKRRADDQLRQNEELGESLNSQLVQDIEVNHEGIQHLKLITGKFRVLCLAANSQSVLSDLILMSFRISCSFLHGSKVAVNYSDS